MKNKKNSFFNMNVKIILLSFISLAASTVDYNQSEEREAIYRKHGCKEGKCEIIEIEIEFSRRQKRSADYSTISFPLKAFGREKTINLRHSDGILVGRNTPVYFTRTTASGTNIETKYGLFSSNMRYQLYEDKENLAAFTLDTDSDVPKVKTGYVASESLLISQLEDDSSQKFSNGSRKQSYLAKSVLNDIYNGIADMIGIEVVSRHPRPDIPIPDVIYPEILVIVDYSVYRYFKKETIIPYLLQFWSGVDMYFHQLQNPMYKLVLGGVIIAEDEFVFDFSRSSRSSSNLIDYESALKKTNSWLKNAKSSIPFSSYDVHIIMTDYLDGESFPTGTIGMATKPSACSGKNYDSPHGGIVYEPHNFEGVLSTAHELGHTFGVDHDNAWSCGQGYVMGPKRISSATKWSKCSIRDFHKTLQTEDFSCTYTKPELGDYSSDGYEPVKNKISEDPRPKENKNRKPIFHVVLTSDKKKLVINSNEFLPGRLIEIYYQNNNLIITQVDTDPSSVDSIDQQDDLQIAVLDEAFIILDPAEINPFKAVNIYHKHRFIYVYQGKKPVPENLEPEDKFNKLSPYFTVNENSKICFEKADFELDKLVKIYYDNNKLYISQRNVPDNEYFNDNENLGSYLQYIGSDRATVYLYPTKINFDKEVCVQHDDDDSLNIYQGEKPSLDIRENNSNKIKYLPEDSKRINNRLPKSEDKKSIPEFNSTFNSEETLSIFSNEFNQKKLVSISFENNKLKVTQVGTPDEIRENILSENENLMIITSDIDKLLLHPARIMPKKEINIRHEKGKINIWQGSDSPPLYSFSKPDIVEILKPSTEYERPKDKNRPIPFDDFNAAIDSGETIMIFSEEFNPQKLVSVSFKNNKLIITQKNMPREKPYDVNDYKNLQTIEPDSMTLVLHPVRINPISEINMRHENGKIYIWQGSDELPHVNVRIPDIIKAIYIHK